MKVLIIWDAGHGPNTPGKRTPPMKNGRQIREYEFNRPTADRGIELSHQYGFETFDTAPERDRDVSRPTRVKRANDATKAFMKKHPDGEVVLVSVHYNAHKSEFDASTAEGIEVFHSPGSKKGPALAAAVLKELLKGTPVTNRGVKAVGFDLIHQTLPPAILAECGFMDDPEEAALMIDPDYQNECAVEILTGIRKFLGVYDEITGTPLMGPATATMAQAIQWAKDQKAPQEFIDQAPLYWEIWPARGLDPAIGWVQFAHETGFLYRDGKSMAGLDASYHNPCGLKTTIGGGDTVSSAHTRFKDWATGITAHADHAALYAGAPGYPRADSPDPRHFTWIRGVANTLEDLSQRWAPSKTYGQTIRDKFLVPLRKTVVKETPSDCAEIASQRDKLMLENKELKKEIVKLSVENDVLNNKLKNQNKKIADAIKTLGGN